MLEIAVRHGDGVMTFAELKRLVHRTVADAGSVKAAINEAPRTTPAKALGIAGRAWTIAQLVDAALAVAPALPTETPPDRRRGFQVIQGGKS